MTTPLGVTCLLAAFVACVSPCFAEEPLPFNSEYDTGWMAKVNGAPILKSEVLARIGKKIEGRRNALSGRPKEFQAAFLEMFDRTLFDLVKEKVVALKATKFGITVSDQEVEDREKEEVARRAGGDREEFKKWLKDRDLTISEWKEQQKADMVMEHILRATADYSTTFVQPEVALAFFNAHPAEFQHPERVRLRVLPIRARRGAEDRALRLAESLRRQVEAGADFAGLTKWSDTEIQQGEPVDLEWRTRGDLEPALADEVFKAADGAFVGPVKGESGIYLARVEGREEARKISFEDAQDEIIFRLNGELRWKAMQRALVKLMTENIIQFSIPHLQLDYEHQKEVLEGR